MAGGAPGGIPGGSIPPEKRAQIEAELRKPESSVADIARRYRLSTTTIRRMKSAMGLTSSETVDRTRLAVEVRREQLALKRREISELFLQRSREALDAMVAPTIIYNFGGKDNTYNEKEVERPPTADLRNLTIIAATALDKHLVAERFDAESAAGPVRGLLEAMGEQLLKNFGPPPGKLSVDVPVEETGEYDASG